MFRFWENLEYPDFLSRVCQDNENPACQDVGYPLTNSSNEQDPSYLPTICCQYVFSQATTSSTTMAASQLPASFGEDIIADAKLLWPTWTVELDFHTDDHFTWYADLLRLCGDQCGPGRMWYEPIICGYKDYSSAEKAGEMLRKDIMNMVLRKFSAEKSMGSQQASRSG